MPHGATILLAAAAAAAALALPFADSLPVFGTSIPNGMAVPCGSIPMPVRHHKTKTRQLHGVVTHTPGCSPDGFCLGLGHLGCGGGLEKDRVESTNQMALNPFGDDYRASGFSWTKEFCETDSDGDGFTNGEELGDPCCQWTTTTTTTMTNANATDDGSNNNGSIDEPALNAREGFVPSHPGVPGSVPPAGVDVSCQSLSSSSSSSSSGGVATTRTTTTTTAMFGSLVLTTIAVSLSLSV